MINRTNTKAVGIHAIGVHLPDEVRTNDWWAESIVETWRERMRKRFGRFPPRERLSHASRIVLDAMQELAADPFQGAELRRVMPAEQTCSEMEIAAARQAIEHADIDPQRIGLVVSYSGVPDYLMIANAPLIHHALGLAPACMSFGIEAVCNSFMHQLELSWRMIEQGAIEFALLVQSNAVTRCVPPREPFSPWLGDGATAVVVGPVGEDLGIKSSAHFTDGSQHAGIVLGVPGGRWHDGMPEYYVEDKTAIQRMFLDVPEVADHVISEALDQAGHGKSAVDFFACHQGTAWLRQVVQQFAGLESAASLDTFATFGSLAAANIPLVLAKAEESGVLRPGQLVVTYSGGSGVTGASLVMRWGR